MEAVLVIIGLLTGATAAWFIAKFKFSGEKGISHELHQKLEDDHRQLKQDMLQKEELVIDLNRKLSSAEADHKHLNERLKEQHRQLDELQERFKTEFKNIANELLEEKSKKFTEHNKTNIDAILKPLNEKIKDFEKKIDETHQAKMMSHAALGKQLEMLKDMHNQMSKEAQNLTKALKGDSKVQGNWGEIILESILEKSGLTKDREYFLQASITTDTGKRLQPDVIIKLPEGKNIIIDAKVSLTAYEKYCSSEAEEERDGALKAHILSLKKHMKDLSGKNYQTLYELDSLDFVLLFVPIEPAFSLAVNYDNDIFNEAFEKNIVIVSTSTLLATLRTIASIWRQEYQNQNALEIARKAGDLYDKFVGFTDDLIKIGKKMDESKDSYTEAMKKLYDGRGNLIGRVEKLRQLGARTSKQLPGNLLDKAQITAGEEDKLF